MFKWIKTKFTKIYCVRWINEDENTCQDIVRAKDIAEAWDIIKRKYGWRALYCISIVEIEPEEFNSERR